MAAFHGVHEEEYDRLAAVKQFDDSKLVVKGLLDSGLTCIPRFFHHPLPSRPGPRSNSSNVANVAPIIDLSGHRPHVVDQVRKAASMVGFFQVTGHGIPPCVLSRTIAAVKAFNEQPAVEKAAYYHRGLDGGWSFFSNFDLFHSKAASWRDTIQVRLAPGAPSAGDLPEAVRTAFGWDREIGRLGEDLLGLLSEGLGLHVDRLKELGCLEARVMTAHYYPFCPQPDLTYGLTPHTDPGVVTVVLQNRAGGLQVKYGEKWVDVEPVPGALVVNVGDILQIMSNDEYVSAEHRVLANDVEEPRVSVAVLFNTSNTEGLYGPLPEIVSPEKPARYRQFTLADYTQRFFQKELDGMTLTNYYRI